MAENENFERDTHFQCAADLLFPEVSKLFFTMYARIEEHSPIEEIDAIEREIKTLLAQRDYDLAMHVLEQASYGEHAFDAEIIFKHITDLTEWPKP